jgi:hypothetical protein
VNSTLPIELKEFQGTNLLDVCECGVLRLFDPKHRCLYSFEFNSLPYVPVAIHPGPNGYGREVELLYFLGIGVRRRYVVPLDVVLNLLRLYHK